MAKKRKFTYDMWGNKIYKGDVVKSSIDFYDLSGSDTPMLEAGEKQTVEEITNGNIRLSGIRSYYSVFEPQEFEKVKKSKKR
jgi:hypothetical protein